MRPIQWLKGHAKWVVAPLLLLLSIVPIVALAPALADSHASFKRLWLGRETVRAPAFALNAAQLETFVAPPTSRGAVPVLAYHGLADKPDGQWTLTPRAFVAQMAMLKQAGFHTISAEQYAHFPGGSAKDLPSRPILVTFDDGRLDSYQHADPILARYGMRATMFAITKSVDRKTPFYLRWDELRSMRRSGRWDVQLHAHDMHHSVSIDAKGTQGAAYANRTYADGELESYGTYQRRVTEDLDEGMKRLRAELGDVRADMFAVPFSADGGWQSNDRRIPAFLDRALHERFAEVFVAGRPNHPPRTAQRTLTRYEARSDTTAEALYTWLALDPRTTRQVHLQTRAYINRLQAAGLKVPAGLRAKAGLRPLHRVHRRPAHRHRVHRHRAHRR
jgi:poly-beta-1,6-N-acetyl-D-glucosamine N-deacetylase